jgi:hypothetical protein
MDLIYTKSLVSNIERSILKKIYEDSQHLSIKVCEQRIDTDIYCDTLYYMLLEQLTPKNIAIYDMQHRRPRSWCISGGYFVLDIYFVEHMASKDYRVSI